MTIPKQTVTPPLTAVPFCSTLQLSLERMNRCLFLQVAQEKLYEMFACASSTVMTRGTEVGVWKR